MSGNIRTISVVSAVVLGSWVTVRSLTASPEPVLDDPPISVTTTKRVELKDASLTATVQELAAIARLGQLDKSTP